MSAPGSLVPLQMSNGTVLTVGAGMEFSTLADACRAAHAGDTIAVQAGTYVNDFTTVSTALRIVAVGGVVNEVATLPPPNGKALLTVNADLSIQGFTFTGGSDGNFDGNISGIRLQGGSLNVNYCYFHDMQEGLLANANAAANVVIDHSEFARNGTGDGYSHNLYVGAVASLTIRNSYFHDANIGHEIKSRAAVTTIINNVIANGANGTASYDIDLPNGGVGRIVGNLIEKGPNAANRYAIHYGGETQYAWANNSLTVAANTIVNDLGAGTYAVLNQSNVNGLNVSADIHNNRMFGFTRSQYALGAANLNNNMQLANSPAISSVSPWQAAPVMAIAPGPQLLTLDTLGHVVSGGSVRLTVNDTAGYSTIAGAAGGVVVNAIAGWDCITTQAGATDTINLIGRCNTLVSAGNDHINAAGLYQSITTTGMATITAANYDNFSLNGAGERLVASGSGLVAVGAAANATVIDVAGDYRLSVAGGARLTIDDQATTPTGGQATTATVTGGGASGMIMNNGVVALTTSDAGACIQAGTGTLSVVGGAGMDTLIGGTGNAGFVLGGGADDIRLSGGTVSVTGGTGVDIFTFRANTLQPGADTISAFKSGTDVLRFTGFGTSGAIASDVVANGSTVLTLTDGTTVTFAGVQMPGLSDGSGLLPSGVSASGGNATLGGADSELAHVSLTAPSAMPPTAVFVMAHDSLPAVGAVGTVWTSGPGIGHTPLVATLHHV